MSDEIVQEPTNGSIDPGQSATRPRKSRKRGKRNRSNAAAPDQQAASGPSQATDEPKSEAAPQPRERERSTRRGGQRSLANGYGDSLDRFFCESRLRFFPREWPVSHRKGVAIARLQDVSRRGNEVLICDQLHEGPCYWPDGEAAGADVSTGTGREVFADSAPVLTPPAEPATHADSDAETDFDPETTVLAQLQTE